MKKFIFLIVLSLFFKAYVCGGECKKREDGVCEGGEEAGKTVCVSDGDECTLKTLCKSLEPKNEAECTAAPTTDDKKYKCVFQAKGSEADSKDQCKEVEKEDTSDTTKSSTKSDEKADDTTKSSTKADEKNGANYAKLSFGLLSLLFF